MEFLPLGALRPNERAGLRNHACSMRRSVRTGLLRDRTSVGRPGRPHCGAVVPRLLDAGGCGSKAVSASAMNARRPGMCLWMDGADDLMPVVNCPAVRASLPSSSAFAD
jgi:hypothetical protein